MTGLMDQLSWRAFADGSLRLFIAALLGGVIGIERQLHRHSAGLRTHILVTLGAAAFVLTGLRMAESERGDPLRVVQGVVIGIGFLGAGTILKRTAPEEVRGLTTAAGIWNAAAVGAAVGAGYLGLALSVTFITFGVLGTLGLLERKKMPGAERTDLRDSAPPPGDKNPHSAGP
jgi:putative Mg2+ transporter-C (MgtC) family protein